MTDDLRFIVGVDIGGTFTDCVCGDPNGNTYIGKSPSTPPHFERGFLDALGAVAAQLGIDLEEFVARTKALYHGCTVGTNALVEGRTAKVGLIATAGHGESLAFMQGGGRLLNSPAEYVAFVAGHEKPPPLVPPALIREVPERIVYNGAVLSPLDVAAANDAVTSLVADGVDSFAVALLWSVVNDEHERAIESLIRAAAPETYVSLSSRVVPKTGEFQRTVATVINALVGPVMASYLDRLSEMLTLLGFVGTFEVMSCSGGLIGAHEVRDKPVLTIGSGPVAGLVGAQDLANRVGSYPATGQGRSLLTLDIGGTTADVGVLPGGVPLARSSNWFSQYEYYIPRLDVRSIGVGGGSIVRYERATQTLKVGPQSAGADPGPAAYARGGSEATICDANLLLGFLNPDFFLNGALHLDVGAAETALARVGEPLGLSAMQTASAVVRIGDSQMADAIRLASIGEGLDPREFALCAYGGGGALHASAIGRELGIREVIVPMGDLAAGWSAFGVARSNALAIEERPLALHAPFDMDALVDVWRSLRADAQNRLTQRGVGDIALQHLATLKYELQTNELTINVGEAGLDTLSSEELVTRFGAEYERLYGEGTGYPAAGVALTSLSVTARSQHDSSDWSYSCSIDGRGPTTIKSERPVVWYELGGQPQPTPIYDGRFLEPGVSVLGPAVIELPNTTIAVRPEQTASVDPGGTIVVHL